MSIQHVDFRLNWPIGQAVVESPRIVLVPWSGIRISSRKTDVAGIRCTNKRIMEYVLV